MDYITTHGRLSEKESRKFFRQIVSAMSHIHQANVVHRDLKLENILMATSDDQSDIRIIDFNLCKILAPGEKSTDFFGTLVIQLQLSFQ